MAGGKGFKVKPNETNIIANLQGVPKKLVFFSNGIITFLLDVVTAFYRQLMYICLILIYLMSGLKVKFNNFMLILNKKNIDNKVSKCIQ